MKGSCSIGARILAALESMSQDNPGRIVDIRKEGRNGMNDPGIMMDIPRHLKEAVKLVLKTSYLIHW